MEPLGVTVNLEQDERGGVILRPRKSARLTIRLLESSRSSKASVVLSRGVFVAFIGCAIAACEPVPEGTQSRLYGTKQIVALYMLSISSFSSFRVVWQAPEV